MRHDLGMGRDTQSENIMTHGLRDQIAQLRAITPQLHAITDEAALIVQKVEAFLGEECKLGLSAGLKFDQHDDGNTYEFYRRLDYTRIDNQFRLVVSEYEEYPSGDATQLSRSAWVNCTREMKLRTIEIIPDLLEVIGQTVQKTIKQTQAAALKVNELLHDLGIGEKEGKP
jgi:hypothetical protein